MSETPVTARDVTAGARDTWLDQLEALIPEARRGFMEDRAPEAAGFLVDAAPRLLALARGVTALADELETLAKRYENDARGLAAPIARGETHRKDADRLRRLLADAAPHTGQETP